MYRFASFLKNPNEFINNGSQTKNYNLFIRINSYAISHDIDIENIP